MHSKWDTTATWSREFLATDDPEGQLPGFELVVEIRSVGEVHDNGRGGNDPDNYGFEDRELIEAYLTLHPDNVRIELPRAVQETLYRDLAEECDPEQLHYATA